MRGFVQNIIVGGGCSGSLSSGTDFLCKDLDLILAFRDFFFCSGGARRNGIVASGGLQSKWYK